MTTKFDELVAKLKEIFQLDKPELDFGVYRIMHTRAKEITEFLENRLAEKVRDALAGNSAAERTVLEKELAEALKNAQALGADPEVLPKVKELRGKIAALGGDDDAEASVYSHLLAFFSRYYDEGDFVSKRRYKEGVYAIPYSGEEVKLHWANSDQYYIKSGENFQNYDFSLAGGAKIHFKLVTAETAKDNIKDNEAVRCFVLWDPATKANVEDEELAESLPDKILEEKDGELYIYFQYLKFKKGAKQADFTKKAIEKIAQTIGGELLAKYPIFALAPTEKDKKRTVLEKHFTTYTEKNTSDYFIHKDLGGFLRRELDFYIKNEMMHLDDIQNIGAFKEIEKNLRQIQAVRTIADELITFMAQLEDFQKKFWLKKKFVTQCDYCLTMDMVPKELHAQVFANKKQLEEWEKLGFPTTAVPVGARVPRDRKPKQGEFDLGDSATPAIDARMVDTKFFDETFKAKLLASIPDIDERCGGLLIHSDNFQALNFLQDRYRYMIGAVYIDPPYNTDASPIMYKNGYKDSSWLCLMRELLGQTPKCVCRGGLLCLTIDDVEYSKVRELIAAMYSEEFQLGTICIKNNPSGRSTPSGLSVSHEYAIISAFDKSGVIGRLPYSDKQSARYKYSDDAGAFEWVNFRKHGGAAAKRNARPRMFYPIFGNVSSVRIPQMEWNEDKNEWELQESPNADEQVFYPIAPNGEERRWKWGAETVAENLSEFSIRKDQTGQDAVFMKSRINGEGTMPLSVWDKKTYSSTEYGTNLLKDIFGEVEVFSFPKSLYAVMDSLRVIKVSNLVLDYFGGSGTTAHAVIALNREDGGKRKYILVEMGDHFETVLKPRIEKVVYSPDWKDGKPQSADKGISHCFKYLALESYEDALNNIELANKGDLLDGAMKDEYLLGYMLDVESKGSIINTDDFRHPFDYQLKIAVDSSGASEKRKIDLVETFNYLIGLKLAQYVREIAKGYAFLDGTLPNGEKAFVLWRDCDKVDDAALNKLLAKLNIKPGASEYDVIYVNGDHAIANVSLGEDKAGKVLKVRQIENEFLDRMFAETK